MFKFNPRKKGISTFIAVLLLIVLAVAAGVLIYAYTMGYLRQTSLKTNEGALIIMSVAQHDGGLHIYAKNVGKDSVTIDSPPDAQTRVYVNDEGWPFFWTDPSLRVVPEGATSEIVVLGLDNSFVGKTAKIKIVTISGAFTQIYVKITSDSVSAPGIYTLTPKVAGTGSGSVALNPPGGSYAPGTVVTVTANPLAGSSFAGWSGDLSGSTSPEHITMDSSKTVTATFNLIPPNQYALSIIVEGVGCSVDKNPDKATYHLNDLVQLTANAAAGWTFAGWSGDLTGSTNPGTVTIDANPEVTATFTQNEYTLTITSNGGGSVTKNPDQATYTPGTVVTLTAIPDSSYSFANWGGSLSGSANPVSITMYGDKTVTATFTQKKIVYVVLCVDTEMWLGHDPYMGSPNPHPTLDMREYSKTSPMTVAAVFDSSFRSSHLDSYGNSFRLTWFAEMDYLMAQSNFVWGDGSPAWVSGYTAVRDILMNYWATEIQAYADEVEYHHHFIIYDDAWNPYYNGPDAGYPEYQMYALDHMIIDRNFYPSAFRSGWSIMTSALSSWLEQWIPFEYTPYSGTLFPTHPSGMNRWQTVSLDSMSQQEDVNLAFARARDFGSAIYSFRFHDRDDMADVINTLQFYLNTADADEANYQGVSFEFVTAREAMQLALRFTDYTPPTFTVSQNSDTYTITSNEPLWGNHPYIALKYSDGTYTHLEAISVGTNAWTVSPTQLPGRSIVTLGIAANDLYGNVRVQTIERSP